MKQVVEAHGGTIAVASEGTGHGATFTVRLPIAGVLARAPNAVERRRTVPLSQVPLGGVGV